MGMFEAAFLVRVAGRDPGATAEFAAHVRTVAWIWLKKNHPERAKIPGEVERLAALACQAVVESPEQWTVPGDLGALLRNLCNDASSARSAGPGEAEARTNAQPVRGSGGGDWVAGAHQEPVRRLLDELPERDRQLLIGVLGRGDTVTPDSSEAAYLRRLLFRARLRFRDLVAASTVSPGPI